MLGQIKPLQFTLLGNSEPHGRVQDFEQDERSDRSKSDGYPGGGRLPGQQLPTGVLIVKEPIRGKWIHGGRGEDAREQRPQGPPYAMDTKSIQ